MITGATGSIGTGLVEGYRRSGYAVVGTARSIEPSGEPDFATVAGDIAQADTAQEIVDLAMTRFGRIDTLVNTAGVYIEKPFTDYTAADFTRITEVNLTGFFHITQRAIRHMLSQASGHIVNISTSLVDHPDSSRPAVLPALTKGGLVAATRSLAIEYASRGIRVNAVSLGVINTPLVPPSSYGGYAALHPLGRMGEIADVVDGILYLEQAGFVTGEILHIDGGQSAGD